MISLCDTIESDTGVQISLSTIKRLLNGQFARIPQIATLNAIALSAGYKDWKDFTLAKAPRGITRPEQSSGSPEQGPGSQQDSADRKQSPGSASPRPGPHASRRFVVAGMLLILVLLATLPILMSHKPNLANIDKAHFSVTKVTGNDIPNTVIFKYNVDSVAADSFF
ncbi:MAG TPA: hypothetical protein VL832_09775, partial [Puia sp.]|nr:hypothetical protein [Puia sp.]